MQFEAFPQNVSRALCALKTLIAREKIRDQKIKDRRPSRYGSLRRLRADC
jgi:hypothetical protein